MKKTALKVIAIAMIIACLLSVGAMAETNNLSRKELHEKRELLNDDREVEVVAEFDGETISYGDEVTLKAELTGYENCSYKIKWQFSTDNTNWVDCGVKGESYTFTVTEENADFYYSAVVVINDVL